MKRISINWLTALVQLVDNKFVFFHADAALDMEGTNIYRLINSLVQNLPKSIFIYRSNRKNDYQITGLTDFGAEVYAAAVDVVYSYREIEKIQKAG